MKINIIRFYGLFTRLSFMLIRSFVLKEKSEKNSLHDFKGE